VLNHPQEYRRMAAVEQDHWWYRALHELVLAAIRRRSPATDLRIVDAGCGTGGLMLFLGARGYRQVQGFDLSEHAVDRCRAAGLTVGQDSLANIGARHGAGMVDVVVSNDVLYFLTPEQQGRFLEGCHAVLGPSGLLIMNLPALAAFRGIHDVSVGIGRRFSRPAVRQLLQANGFDPERETYWPFLLSPLIFLVRLGQRIRLRLQAGVAVRSDVSLPPRALNALLYRLVRFENRRLSRKPWGSSLFVVARRRAAGPPAGGG
jgi:SAM-dependent methyltransferase